MGIFEDKIFNINIVPVKVPIPLQVEYFLLQKYKLACMFLQKRPFFLIIVVFSKPDTLVKSNPSKYLISPYPRSGNIPPIAHPFDHVWISSTAVPRAWQYHRRAGATPKSSIDPGCHSVTSFVYLLTSLLAKGPAHGHSSLRIHIIRLCHKLEVKWSWIHSLNLRRKAFSLTW